MTTIDWNLSAAWVRLDEAFNPRIRQICWGIRHDRDLPHASSYHWTDEELTEIARTAKVTVSDLKSYLAAEETST